MPVVYHILYGAGILTQIRVGRLAGEPVSDRPAGGATVIRGSEVAPMSQLKSLVDNWILLAQGLIGSIGALAFLIAFMYKIVAVDPRSVMEAKRWIGRIVFGTIGVEVAGTLTHAIISSIPGGVH